MFKTFVFTLLETSRRFLTLDSNLLVPCVVFIELSLEVCSVDVEMVVGVAFSGGAGELTSFLARKVIFRRGLLSELKKPIFNVNVDI